MSLGLLQNYQNNIPIITLEYVCPVLDKIVPDYWNKASHGDGELDYGNRIKLTFNVEDNMELSLDSEENIEALNELLNMYIPLNRSDNLRKLSINELVNNCREIHGLPRYIFTNNNIRMGGDDLTEYINNINERETYIYQYNKISHDDENFFYGYNPLGN